MRHFYEKNKSLLLYGAVLALVLFSLKCLELHYMIINPSFEIYTGAIAAIFTVLGIWLTLKLARPKTVVVEKEIVVSTKDFVFNQRALDELSLSKRELEVLELMAEGCSNQEIAGRLFVSLNTIKTHSSNVFEKMDVKRRTQAVEKAKRLRLIP